MVNEQRNCALKLVNEISLYYEARSKKHYNYMSVMLGKYGLLEGGKIKISKS